MEQIIKKYQSNVQKILSDPAFAATCQMPGESYFLEDGSILSFPRDDGDSRYPYGQKGFNFWTYASGYMHCNDGLFSPFLRANEGGEPKIAFFATFKDSISDSNATSPDLETTKVIPLLSVPVIATETENDAFRYTIFTTGATYYFCETHGVQFVIRVIVDTENQLYFTLYATVASGKPVAFTLSYFMNPFIKNAIVENSVDRWFRRSSYIEDDQLGHFIFEAYEEVDRSKMAPNLGLFELQPSKDTLRHLKKHEITTSRYRFVGGARSSLHTPKALYEGTFGTHQPVCAFTETAIAAYLLDFEIHDSIRIDTRFSYAFTQHALDDIQKRKFDAETIDSLAISITREQDLQLSELSFDFEQAPVLNRFIEVVKKQVEFCSVIKGYIQLSSFSLIGIRDVFQALEALVYYEPHVAREKMLEALNFITKEGRCPRQYILPPSPGATHSMDLRPFIDQGVWVISTIVTYLKHTHDFDFLSETTGYYKFIDEHRHLACQDTVNGTVFEHMLAIMDYLLVNRDPITKCVLALYGDWNDALDGLGKSKDPSKAYGTGVSVMATLQVYQNLTEMLELLDHEWIHSQWETLVKTDGMNLSIRNRDSFNADNSTHVTTIEALHASYAAAKSEIEQGLKQHGIQRRNGELKLVHGWGDAQSYYVGSFLDPDGVSRDGLTSQAFWVLSGLLDTHEYEEKLEIKSSILKAYERLESKYGLKTFSPHFEPNTEGVGRIPNLPAGTAENGAAYIHASLFGVMSLFKMGESKTAWEELFKVLPITHSHVSCSPFVMPNSYGENIELFIDGESMSDWQTGSSNVLLKTLLRYVLGYIPSYDGILLQPAADLPYESLKAELSIRGHKIIITITASVEDEPYALVNGTKYELGSEGLFLDNEYLEHEGRVIEVEMGY